MSDTDYQVELFLFWKFPPKWKWKVTDLHEAQNGMSIVFGSVFEFAG